MLRGARLQLLDAVNKGTLDGGHGVVAYHYGKNNGAGAVGLGPGLRHGPQHGAGLAQYGGGKALLAELYASIGTWMWCPSSTARMPTQPLGWFKKPIAKVEDMKGLKFRTVGMAVDVFTSNWARR